MLRRATTTSIPGVLFVEDFDQVDGEDCAVAPSIQGQTAAGDPPVGLEPVESEAPALEMEMLQAQAREDGFAQGLRAAEDGLAAQRVAILDRIEGALDQATSSMRADQEHAMEIVAHTALTLLAECLPAFCERLGAGEMSALVRSILPSLADETTLTITVRQDLAELVRQEVSSLGRHQASPIVVAGCGEMLPGDICLAWQNGTACRDVRRLRSDILKRLSDVGLLAEDGKGPIA